MKRARSARSCSTSPATATSTWPRTTTTSRGSWRTSRSTRRNSSAHCGLSKACRRPLRGGALLLTAASDCQVHLGAVLELRFGLGLLGQHSVLLRLGRALVGDRPDAA